jgi:hypothetical protein
MAAILPTAEEAEGWEPGVVVVWQRSHGASSPSIPTTRTAHKSARKWQRERGGRNRRFGWTSFTAALECYRKPYHSGAARRNITEKYRCEKRWETKEISPGTTSRRGTKQRPLLATSLLESIGILGTLGTVYESVAQISTGKGTRGCKPTQVLQGFSSRINHRASSAPCILRPPSITTGTRPRDNSRSNVLRDVEAIAAASSTEYSLSGSMCATRSALTRLVPTMTAWERFRAAAATAAAALLLCLAWLFLYHR